MKLTKKQLNRIIREARLLLPENARYFDRVVAYDPQEDKHVTAKLDARYGAVTVHFGDSFVFCAAPEDAESLGTALIEAARYLKQAGGC